MVFIVNGSGGVGKTEFEKMVMEKAFGECLIFSIVDKVKQVAREFGWQGEKDNKARKMLADLKDLMDEYNNSCYIDIVDKIQWAWHFGQVKIIFVDMRSKEDIDKLKKDFPNDIKIIKMIRDVAPRHYGNHADDNVNEVEGDIIIYNTGTLEDLDKIAEKFAIDCVHNSLDKIYKI